MDSKTPQFDALLDKILEDLVPHERTCGECQKEFTIESKDIDFYKKRRGPPSKLCPPCRNRQRLSFANYSSIYKRTCDVPGHTDTMVSPVATVMPWVSHSWAVFGFTLGFLLEPLLRVMVLTWDTWDHYFTLFLPLCMTSSYIYALSGTRYVFPPP